VSSKYNNLIEQATWNGFISISERQEEQDAVNARQDAINASVLQMVASRSTDGVDDNATPSHGEVVVVVVVVVKVQIEMVVTVAVKVEATTKAELMDRLTWPRTVNTGRLIPAVGPMGMIVQGIMTVKYVTIRQQDIKTQQ
jgi:hypothetical protein